MKYVLFVCTHNAGRSQIAQAFFERYAPGDVRAESAGDEPAEAVWPNVVEAMAEVGIDIAGRRPKKLDLEMQLHADWAITLGCGGVCPYVPTMVEDWQIPDPAGLTLEQTRPIRDLLETKVQELIETRLDAIRSDGTAHAMRLQRLLPSLIEDFGAEKPAEEIRACADLMLQPFDDAPVRSFVLTLARRKPRSVCARDVAPTWWKLPQTDQEIGLVQRRVAPSRLTDAGVDESVFVSKPGDRKVGGLRRFLAAVVQVDAELA